jgi:hypothetical protein
MPPTNAQPPMPPAFVHRPPSASINRSFTPAYHTRRAPHRPQPQPQYHSETLLEFDGYPQKEEQPDPETLYQFGPTDVIEIEDSAGSLVSQARSQTPTTSPEPVRPKTQCTYQRKKGDALPTPQSASSSNSNNVFAPVMPTNTPALRSRKRKAPTSSEGDSNLAKSATPATPTDEDVKPPPKKRTAAPKKRATQPKAAPAKAAPAKAAPAKKAHAKKAPAKKPAAKKTGSKKAPPSRAETPVPREVIELLGDDILNSISVDTPDLGRTRSATRLSRETSTGTPKIPGAIAEGSQEEDEEEDKEIDITDGDALIGLDWD